MGDIDRIVRTLAAILVGVFYLTGQIGGWTAVILGLIAVVFLTTSFVGTCPLYTPLGWSTRRKSRAHSPQ